MHFANRGDLQNFDFSAFTKDGALHNLDLVGIVPNDNRKKQILVKVEGFVTNVSGADIAFDCIFAKSGYTGGVNCLGSNGHNIAITGKDNPFLIQGLIDIGNDLTLAYKLSNVALTYDIHLTILGWYYDCFGC